MATKIELTRQRIQGMRLNPEFYDTDEKKLQRLLMEAVDDNNDLVNREWHVVDADSLVVGSVYDQDDEGLVRCFARITETATRVVG